MVYVTKDLSQNVPSQAINTLNPQFSKPDSNQQLNPQDVSASVPLTAQKDAASMLNTSSTYGVSLPETTPQNLTTELDTAMQNSTPPYVPIGIFALFVVIFVLIVRKVNQ